MNLVINGKKKFKKLFRASNVFLTNHQNLRISTPFLLTLKKRHVVPRKREEFIYIYTGGLPCVPLWSHSFAQSIFSLVEKIKSISNSSRNRSFKIVLIWKSPEVSADKVVAAAFNCEPENTQSSSSVSLQFAFCLPLAGKTRTHIEIIYRSSSQNPLPKKELIIMDDAGFFFATGALNCRLLKNIVFLCISRFIKTITK